MEQKYKLSQEQKKAIASLKRAILKCKKSNLAIVGMGTSLIATTHTSLHDMCLDYDEGEDVTDNKDVMEVFHRSLCFSTSDMYDTYSINPLKK